ncbi:MAG: shikimate dehydrogenase [Pirellulaceae bacterium]
MICVTLGRTRHKYLIAEHQHIGELGGELVELRLDYIGRTIDLSRILKDRPTAVVITCRRKSDGGRWERPEDERRMLLRSAIATGVEYVDLEEDAAAAIPRYGKTKRIISFHNFQETPADLEAIHQRLLKHDADIVKIATLANTFSDVVRMLELMDKSKVPTIGIAMGDMGGVTRLLAARFGAPFTYCSFDSERQIAPGQFSFKQMRDLYRVDSIDANTKLFGVVADPVAHSYSPLIHNSAFAHHGIQARYLPFRIPEEELPVFLRWCRTFGIGGLSVTIPHKETILPLLSRAEQAAQEIGAVNTVVFNQDEAIGYNTDYRAAMDCLTDAMKQVTGQEEPFKGRTVLLLGAGGVSRAIGFGLRQRGAFVEIASRSMERTESLARAIGAKAISWDSRYDVRPALIVNGTPIGMFPDVDNTPYDGEHLDASTLVFDTVYNPESTLLVKTARKQGCPVLTGSYMFIRQACYQYKLFTGLEPPADVMRATLQKAISPLRD